MKSKIYPPKQPCTPAHAFKNGWMLLPAFFTGLVKRRFVLVSFTRFSIVAFFLFLFSNQAMADYTIGNGSTINASSITGQTGILTINGRLDLTSDVSLTGFSSVIINAPNGQIYWSRSSITLAFAAGTTIVINNNAPGLQPTAGSGNGSQKLVVGTTVISVSSDNSNNAAFSFGQFNALGGLPQFTITGNAQECFGNPISLTITPDKTSAVSYTYDWSITPTPVSGTFSNNPATSLTSATTSITLPSGNYTISCAIKATGDPLATKTFAATISSIPGASSAPSATPATICAGSSANLNAVSASNSISWYTVATGGTSIGTSASGVNFPVTPAGTATYYAETVNAAGCPATTRRSVTVTVNNPVVISAQPATNAICVGSDATISVTATGTITSYQWQESTTGIGGMYRNLSNSVLYSNVTKAKLDISTPAVSLSSNYYRLVVTGAASCGSVSTNSIALQYKNLWTGVLSTDWNNTGNWSNGQLPSVACSDVYIQNTYNQPLLSNGTATISNLNILSGAMLTVNNTGTLQIAGSISNNGIFDVKNGKLEFNGTTAQTISANVFSDNILNHLLVSNTTALIIAASPANALRIAGEVTFGKSNVTLNTNDNLVLASSVSKTARVADITNNGAFTGNKFVGKVTVERFYPQSRSWRLVTSPLSNTGSIFDNWQNAGNYSAGKGMFVTGPNPTGNSAIGNGLDWSGFNNYSMKGWDAASNAYISVANTKTRKLSNDFSSAGKASNIGYYAFVRGDRSRTPDNTIFGNGNTTTLSSKGYLQTGTQTFDLTGGNGATPTFALVANPYASSVDFRKVTKNNVVPYRFYVYDPSLGTVGVFVVMEADLFNPNDFTPSIPNSNSVQRNHIQSSQAFFVQVATPGAASLTFNEDDKSTDYEPKLFRPATPASGVQMLRTSLLQTNADNSTLLVDAALVQFDDQFTDKVDVEDALKFMNISENLSILRDNQYLTIERRPLVKSTDTIFLQLSRTTQRSYRFEFVATNMDPLVSAWLEDSFTGKSTLLNLNATFNIDFIITADAQSSVANRFRIVFKQVGLSTLPVTFKAIHAVEQAGKVAVNWTVENELNIKNYEVEKSGDGVIFEKLTTTVATGANKLSTTYSWLDANPLTGNNFYRVRSIGMDGQFDYSKTVLVKIAMVASGSIRIYPNPVTDGIIAAEFKNMAAGIYNMRLLNAQGQAILNKKVNHSSGTSMEYIQPDYKMTSGIYQLEITAPGKGVTMVKVIVK